MRALFASWIPHFEPKHWYVLAVLAAACLLVAVNHVFAARRRLMAKALNWRSATYGKRTSYYVMLALCGNGNDRNRLDSLEVEVSRDDYARAANGTEYFAVDCSIGFITKSITVKSPVLHAWPPPAA